MLHNKNSKSIIISVWNYKGAILISLNKIIKHTLNSLSKASLFFLYGKSSMNLFMDTLCDVRLLYSTVITSSSISLGSSSRISSRSESCVEISLRSSNDKPLFDEMPSVSLCLNFRFPALLYKTKHIVSICLFHAWIS